MATDATFMLESLTTLYREIFLVDDSNKLVGCANVWAFVIPKNASKALFIFHLVALNKKKHGKPPSFTLPTIESLARLLKEKKRDELKEPNKISSRWATHVDLRNCLWSMELPQAFWFSFEGQNGVFKGNQVRAPFVWFPCLKMSPCDL